MIPGMPSLSLASSESQRTDSTSRQGSGPDGGGGQRGVLFNIATGASKLTSSTSADAGGIPVWVWIAGAGGLLALGYAFLRHRR